jgi:4-hydroxy-3-methylbut-2-enyl diphosphate reductase
MGIGGPAAGDSGTVLILPAFGLPPAEHERFRATGARLVDTTCGSVRAVWRNVGRLARDGFTLVYHGLPGHEEARSTLARAGGPWCVVRDGRDADALASRIRGGPGAGGLPLPASPGFDPARHLARIGLAHQTTMRAAESLAIAETLKAAAVRRWGADAVPGRFRGFETLCLETQRRQDAVAALGRTGVDRFLVVGGRQSNNSRSLLASAARWAPAYHLEGPEDLLGPSAIRHWNGRGNGERGPSTDLSWLPPGPVVVGVTAGASTPDAVTAAVVRRLMELAG